MTNNNNDSGTSTSSFDIVVVETREKLRRQITRLYLVRGTDSYYIAQVCFAFPFSFGLTWNRVKKKRENHQGSLRWTVHQRIHFDINENEIIRDFLLTDFSVLFLPLIFFLVRPVFFRLSLILELVEFLDYSWIFGGKLTTLTSLALQEMKPCRFPVNLSTDRDSRPQPPNLWPPGKRHPSKEANVIGNLADGGLQAGKRSQLAHAACRKNFRYSNQA